jgi:hypothetical protein
MEHPAHARAFLAEISKIVPAGYRVFIQNDLLRLVMPGGGEAGSSAYWLTSDALLEEEAISGATQTLHQIQQEIGEETTEPSPARAGHGYPGFPEPGAELVDSELRMWFGRRDNPVLELEPIDLDAVLVRD